MLSFELYLLQLQNAGLRERGDFGKNERKFTVVLFEDVCDVCDDLEPRSKLSKS